MTLDKFEPLTEAERKVIAGLGSGLTTVLGDGTLPGESAGEDRQVRASLIRWLALGAPGDDSVRLHEKGLRIKGALVVSDGSADPVLKDQATPGLDLEGCTLAHDLALLNCCFKHAPFLLDVRVQSLFLSRSALPGLLADRLEARGDMILRGVHATGEVRLPGAGIGGVLDCAGGHFENAGGWALTADGARNTGALFWRRGSHAKGTIDLTAAEIGHINDDPGCWPGRGHLVLNRCLYGAFTGKGVSGAERIRWLDLQTPERFGAEFWPQPWEHCARVLREMGHGEDARQVLIAKEERQRRVKRQITAARLTGARLRKRLELVKNAGEEETCSQAIRSAIVEFENSADPRRNAVEDQVNAASDLRHHNLQQKSGDAEGIIAQVAAKADRLGTRAADPARAAQSAVTEAWLALAGLRLRDALLSTSIAYGHRPLRAVGWLAALWIVGALMFGIAFGNGAFKPNNAFILARPDWAQCEAEGDRRGDHPSTLDCYRAQPGAAGYPAFNAALYSLDTLLPVVDLEVQDYWVPDARAAPLARWYLWAHIAAGWALTLLAVAGFSGLVQSRASEE